MSERPTKEHVEKALAIVDDTDANVYANIIAAVTLAAEVRALRAEADGLRELGRKLSTQDNRITAHPIFMVQSRKRIYGMDPQYAETFAWITQDDGDELSQEESAECENRYDETGEDEDDVAFARRVAYIDLWENVQPFFTEAAATDYIASQKHHMTDPRIYVESGHRNPEWKMIRSLALAALDGGKESK